MGKRYLKFYLITDRKGRGGAQVYFEDLLNSLGTENTIIFDLKQGGILNLIKRLYTLRKRILFVSAHSSVAVAVGRIICRIFSIKFYGTIHGWSFKRSGRWSIEYLVERTLVLFGGINVCVSYDDLQIAERLGYTDNILLMNYGKDKRVSIETRSDKTIVMVARNSKQKDYSSALAVARVMPEYSFKFIGENVPDLRGIENIPDNVELLNHTSRLELILSQSKYFMLLSHYEGLPLSALEALSCDMTLILSDVGGNAEIFNKGALGLLVKDNFNKQMIADFIRNTEVPVNVNRQVWLDHFTRERWTEEINRIYG